MEPEQPTPQHLWLQQLVGHWDYEMSWAMGPDTPPATLKGREVVEALGQLRTVGHGSNDHDKSIMTLGYDPQAKQFIGTFIAGMMSHLWCYTGQLDKSTNTLTLDASGPAMPPADGTANYQDIIQIVDANTRVLRSLLQLPDGSWVQFMESRYTRVAG